MYLYRTFVCAWALFFNQLFNGVVGSVSRSFSSKTLNSFECAQEDVFVTFFHILAFPELVICTIQIRTHTCIINGLFCQLHHGSLQTVLQYCKKIKINQVRGFMPVRFFLFVLFRSQPEAMVCPNLAAHLSNIETMSICNKTFTLLINFEDEYCVLLSRGLGLHCARQARKAKYMYVQRSHTAVYSQATIFSCHGNDNAGGLLLLLFLWGSR